MTTSFKLNKKGLFQFRLRAIIYGLTVSLPLAAQAMDNPVPATADASRVAESFTSKAPIPNLAGPTVPAFKPQVISPEAAKITFTLKQLNVSGATIFGNQQIANMFQNFIGKKVSLADLQRIADNITLKYRNAGYTLSKAVIPAQQIKNGVVNIVVVEGYISQVNINGDPRGARQLLEQYADRLKAARPLNIKTLERYALLANDIPGVSVKTILSAAQIQRDELAPSTISNGAAVATFVVAEHTANGYLSYDNRGTRYLGPTEASVGAAMNSIFRSGDQTGVRALNTIDVSQLHYINLYHNTPIGSDGVTLNVNGTYTYTKPGYTLEPLDITGKSEDISANLSYPLIRERGQSLFLNTMFEWLNNSSNTGLTGGGQIYDDHVRSLRIGSTYDYADSWFGLNEVGAQISQGLHILGASNNDSPTTSRPDGKSDYTKLNASASRLQGLGHNFSVYAAAQGQYGFVPLLTSEQFGYGGSQFGQAYDPSEITGDRGVSAKAELRYDIQPGLRVLNNIQLYTFYDIGKVWNINSNNGVNDAESGSSAGLGVRTNFTHFFASTLEVAKPLTRDVTTEQNRNPRVFFSVTLFGDTPASENTVRATTLNTPTVAVPTYSGLSHMATTSVKQPVVEQSQQTSTVTTAQIFEPAKATLQPTTTSNQNYEGLTPTNTITSSKPAPMISAKSNTSAKIKDGFYTIQLLGSRNVSDLQAFANRLNLAHPKYLQLEKTGQPWYVLTYGQFHSSRAASNALHNLPTNAREANAWVRHIAAGTPTV